MPVLVLDPGGPKERTYELAEGESTIGRTNDNTVGVLDKSLSRKHATLEVQSERITIRDAGSKNGTSVNGRRITECEVEEGDLLKLGDVSFSIGRPRAPAQQPMLTHSGAHDLTHMGFSDLLAKAPSGQSALRIEALSAAEEKLRILLKVSELLSLPMPLDALLAKILDLAFEILDVSRGAVLLVDEETGALAVSATRGAPEGDTTFFSESIVRYVERSGDAALFADAQADERVQEAKSILAQSICASMCAPFKPKERVLGVLYVDNILDANRFAAADLEFLSAFANQAGIAIENAMLQTQVEKETVLRTSLLRFFPPSTVKRVLDAGSTDLGTIDTEITALFSDISGFTAMSSGMSPREVVDLLNDYLPPMSEIVFRHEGTLEKYIGDALLAVWGAPYRADDDADRALLAAIDMQRALGAFNAKRGARGHPPIMVHIGLNTGMVAAGNVGSGSYVQYATIGDATNVASRVCTAAQDGEVVISEATRERIKKPPCPFEALPPVQVKGKIEPLTLHRVRWDLAK